MWTQAAAAVQSLAMAALTLAHVITLWEIIALAALQGLINAFDMPGRQSFLVQMVDDRERPGQCDRDQFVDGECGAAGWAGDRGAGDRARSARGGAFLIDGVSYLAVIASLLMMRITPAETSAARRSSMLEQMREGWNYVRTFRPIRTILLLFALLSLMGYSYSVLLPIFAGDVLHGGAHTLGWLTGASGIGALVSGLSLALRKSVVGLTRMMQVSAGMFGAGLVLFGLSHVLWLSLLLMMCVGFGMMQCAAVVNTMVQSLVSEDKRGRVMSYYTMAFVGSAPFGSLLAGMLAHEIGAPHTVMITGGLCMAGAVWFALRLPAVDAAMRPVYEAKGFLPADDTDLVVEESSAA